MKPGSLDAIISDIIRRIEASRTGDGARVRDPIAEAARMLPADAVLASLHKDYLEARCHYRTVRSRFGLHDPMAEVAADMLDSARSAVQTRLIELRDLRDNEEARIVMERSVRAHYAGKEAAAARAAAQKRARDQDTDNVFWLALFFWFLNNTFATTRQKLSATGDFALATARSLQSEFRSSRACC